MVCVSVLLYLPLLLLQLPPPLDLHFDFFLPALAVAVAREPLPEVLVWAEVLVLPLRLEAVAEEEAEEWLPPLADAEDEPLTWMFTEFWSERPSARTAANWARHRRATRRRRAIIFVFIFMAIVGCWLVSSCFRGSAGLVV